MKKEVRKWKAGELMGIASGYWQPCTLHAAVKLDVFSVLADKKLSAREISCQIDCDERAVATLLNALVSMDLLTKEDGKYANTPSSRALLAKDSPDYIGYIILHHHSLVDGWAQLDQAVKQGIAVAMRSQGEAFDRESFQMGMFNIAMSIAPPLAEQIDLSGRKHLLDLGGGPGTHAIHFCLANPQLKATILDLPTTWEFATATIKKFHLENRIDFVAGDFTTDEVKGPYDVAWLSQILHSNGPEDCQRIIAKTVAALEPGGIIMIHEFFLNETMDGPLFPALFSLNMLINNGDGRSYSEKQIAEMLMKEGVRDIHRLPFQGPNDSYVLCGTV